MYKGILVYKGTTLAEKTAIVPAQVRKIDFMMKKRQDLDISTSYIILADLCGVLLGLRRSEFFASAEKCPNRNTLLCFHNLAGFAWDLGDLGLNAPLDEIMKVRLCYSKHYRHRVVHEVIAGPGYRLMSFVLWIKITVKLRVKFGEALTVKSPLLVRVNKGRLVPMTGAYMA